MKYWSPRPPESNYVSWKRGPGNASRKVSSRYVMIRPILDRRLKSTDSRAPGGITSDCASGIIEWCTPSKRARFSL